MRRGRVHRLNDASDNDEGWKIVSKTGFLGMSKQIALTMCSRGRTRRRREGGGRPGPLVLGRVDGIWRTWADRKRIPNPFKLSTRRGGGDESKEVSHRGSAKCPPSLQLAVREPDHDLRRQCAR